MLCGNGLLRLGLNNTLWSSYRHGYFLGCRGSISYGICTRSALGTVRMTENQAMTGLFKSANHHSIFYQRTEMSGL